MDLGHIFFDQSDIMSLDNGLAEEIMVKVKENYVQNNHIYAISYIENKDYWKTYVGNPRKGVTRKTRQKLIDFLYDYYKQDEASVEEIFRQAEIYRREVLNRNENTIRRDEQTYNRFISKSFGSLKVTAVDEETLDRFISGTVKRLKPSKRALKDLKNLLNAIFSYAYMKKLIIRNPVNWINLENYFKDCAAAVKSDEERIFTPDEIEKIKKEVRERIAKRPFNPRGYAVLLSIETGMRIGELPPLRWSDIKNDCIHIYRQQQDVREKGKPITHRIVEYTKNERLQPKGGRVFPVTETIRDILSQVRKMQKDFGVESDYIFCDEKGEPVQKNSIALMIRRCCEAVGLPITNNHAFRRSLNSNVLIPAGFTVVERAYLLGHSPETNQRFYSYIREERIEKLREMLNSSENKSESSRLLCNQDISFGALEKSPDGDCAFTHSRSLKKVVPFEQRKSPADKAYKG